MLRTCVRLLSREDNILWMAFQVKIGAPKFLGVSLLFWGLFSASFAAVQNVASFYSLRVLLGVAETGAFPGAGSP